MYAFEKQYSISMDVNVLNGFLKDEHDLEGWFFPPDMASLFVLDRMHSNSKIKGDIVELGVYKGKSFSFLSHLIKENETLFGYDTFPEDYYESTKLALEKYGAIVKFELIKADTSELNDDNIKAKVLKVDIDKKKIALSIKAHEENLDLSQIEKEQVDMEIWTIWKYLKQLFQILICN